MMTKKKGLFIAVSIVIFMVVAGVFVISSISNAGWYSTEEYRVKVPESLTTSVDGKNLLFYQNSKIVGGVTHYSEAVSDDEIVNMLQHDEEWSSYSLESDTLADKLLVFVNGDGEYHHYIYHTQGKGTYVLWVQSEAIQGDVEIAIVEQFEIL